MERLKSVTFSFLRCWPFSRIGILQEIGYLTLCSLVMVLLLGEADGASFAPVVFEDTIRSTPLIVKCKMGMHYSDWSTDSLNNRRLYTFYECNPLEVLKGPTPTDRSTLWVRELGGQKEGYAQSIPGTAQFETGEETVLLLGSKQSEGWSDIQGMMTGKFGLRQNAAGEEVLVGGILDPSQAPTWTVSGLRQLIERQKTPSGEPDPATLPTPSLMVSKSSPPPTQGRLLSSTPPPTSPPSPSPLPEPSDSPALAPSADSGWRRFGILTVGIAAGILFSRILRRQRR
jgi:hypothetical protein